MAMSYYSNPIPEIVDGLLKGHQLGLSIMAGKRQQQQFLTDQALKNSQMSMQDIMNQHTLLGMGRPVSSTGTVQDTLQTPSMPITPGSSGAAPTTTPDSTSTPDLTNLPTKPGPTMPGQTTSYQLPADPSRVATYTDRFGNKTSAQLYTPEEENQRAIAMQTSGMQALEDAKLRAQMNSIQALHNNQLKLEGGGIPAQGLGVMGIPDGTLLTRDENAHYNQALLAHIQAQQEIQKGYRLTVRPGETVYDTAPQAGAPTLPGPAGAPTAPGAPTIGAPTSAPTTPGGPPLANNPTVQRMRMIASGGPANPTGEYAEFKNTFLPGYYQAKGITNPQPEDEQTAFADFQRQKAEAKPTEMDLALRAARGDQQAAAALRLMAQNKVSIAVNTAGAKADAAGLSDDDYARAGEQYARTGVMPAMGRDSVTRAKIVKAGNQWARDNGLKPSDVVTLQAAYQGDKDSLKKFQAQRDQIVSFEQTAQKNLDQFLQLASAIPDAGVPWLNTPLRNLSANLIGSANMAAVNAARQVANNEIAKVTSGGGLSGVLSDSARHEIGSYNPANATFAQTKAVANILRQDMANRHASMDSALEDIKSRIGGAGAPPAAAAAPAQPTGGGRGSPGAGGQTAPGGYLRQAKGPNGHMIGQRADGGWYDVQTGARVQ